MLGLLGLGPVREKPQAQAQRQLQVRLVRLTRREPQEQLEQRVRQEPRALRVREQQEPQALRGQQVLRVPRRQQARLGPLTQLVPQEVRER